MSRSTGAEGTFEQSHDQTQTITLTCSAEWSPAGWSQEIHFPEKCAGHTTGYSSRFQFPELTGKTDLPGRRFGIAPQGVMPVAKSRVVYD